MLSKISIVTRSWRLLQTSKSLGSLTRFTSTLSVQEIDTKRSHEEWSKAKPFKAIPGPGLLEVIRWFLPGGK